MHPTAVILIVGLNESLIGDWSPRIAAFASKGRVQRLCPVLPAVTCSVQASMLTGLLPTQHGIVGNGWYDRALCEVQFWKQSNHLMGGPKVWDLARQRDASFTCAQMFWWFNMYAAADWSVTPRPIYKADGRKIPDVYTQPPELRQSLQDSLGQFPLFKFWGPAASIQSSQWIADATRQASGKHNPTLTLVYLPHLDYALQKAGPKDASITDQVAKVDVIVGELIDHFTKRGVRVILASEYGIEPVDDAVAINRVLRAAGMLRVREEEGLELLDAGASDAFAVADHQVAHVYLRDAARIERVADLCRGVPGVEQVLSGDAKAAAGLDHPRAGDLVLIAQPRRWFSYHYWLDDSHAPDFARTVDIHRKPGYDPLELFIDPAIRFPRGRIAWTLLKKKLGLRSLMDVIPLDGTLVRGSHGRVDQPREFQPLVITQHDTGFDDETMPCTALRDVMLSHIFND